MRLNVQARINVVISYSIAHSLEHSNLLHSDGSLVFGSHVGKHIGSKPRKTSIIVNNNVIKLQSHFIVQIDC